MPGTDEGIAIVGMACRFPGAPDIAAFVRQLEAGRDAVTDGRPDAGAGNGLAGGSSIGEGSFGRGGFVTEIDRFDARFFGIRPIEARLMDPRQRMLLETSWQALEDAGIDPERLRGSLAGVYVGIAASEYRDLMTARDGISYLGTAGSMTVGRVSFQFGLAGPTMPVELNCASALVAVASGRGRPASGRGGSGPGRRRARDPVTGSHPRDGGAGVAVAQGAMQRLRGRRGRLRARRRLRARGTPSGYARRRRTATAFGA